MPLPGPDTRVTEMRVPGMIGTTGVSLLDSTDTVEVAGDGIGQVIRPADRLHRPAPGPVLQALGRSVPRTLEGYLWSKMTSGGAMKATWALLFPFSLANVAHWMLPPVASGRSARWLAAACSGLLRLGALLLTMLLISQVAVLSLDLLATQCLAPGAACLTAAPGWLRELEPSRTAAGLLPVLVVVLVLHRVSGKKWDVDGAQDTRDEAAQRLPGDAVRAGGHAPVLRCLHTVAALSVIALMLLGGPLHPPGTAGELTSWLVAFGLLGIAALGTTVRLDLLFGRVVRAILQVVAVLLVLAGAILATPLAPGASGMPGTDDTVAGVGAVLVVVCVLFAGLLIPAALLARRDWRGLPRRLRPWAGGWAAAPAFALACLIGGGFGAGLAIALRKLAGSETLRLPDSYTLITMLWGAGVAVVVLLALIGFAVAVPLRMVRRGIPDVVRILHTGDTDRRKAAAAWARASWERHWLHRFVLAFVLTMCVGAAALLIAEFGLHAVPGWLRPLSGIGVAVLGVLAVVLLRAVFTAATGPQRPRRLAALADLVCFWPRTAHPTVPPCYALKVVPEVTARARQHLAEPNTRVVLAGYHIGGLLAVTAASRLLAEVTAEQRERIGLLTAGSPLQWGYQRAFPAVFPLDSLVLLYDRLDGRWRGLCRGTDAFGGGATTWRHQVLDAQLLGVGYLPDGGMGPLPAATQGPTGALVIGGDHWLPDPMREPLPGRRWVSGVRKHADYVADPEWDRAVAIAAGLERPGRPARPLAEQVPLFPDLPRQAGKPLSGPDRGFDRHSSVTSPPDPEQDEHGSAD